MQGGEVELGEWCGRPLGGPPWSVDVPTLPAASEVVLSGLNGVSWAEGGAVVMTTLALAE